MGYLKSYKIKKKIKNLLFNIGYNYYITFISHLGWQIKTLHQCIGNLLTSFLAFFFCKTKERKKGDIDIHYNSAFRTREIMCVVVSSPHWPSTAWVWNLAHGGTAGAHQWEESLGTGLQDVTILSIISLAIHPSPYLWSWYHPRVLNVYLNVQDKKM